MLRGSHSHRNDPLTTDRVHAPAQPRAGAEVTYDLRGEGNVIRRATVTRDTFRTYGVKPAGRQPLIQFMLDALTNQGCRIIHKPASDHAPFRMTFETTQGERIGIVAYAFLANKTVTRKRPVDEQRFQIKYGGDLSGLHELWQDPYGLYVTLLLGINPTDNFFVAADPLLHNPTRFSVSVEYKDEHVDELLSLGWHAWERERRGGSPHPTRKRAKRAAEHRGEPLFEALVGGVPEHFLRLIRFEREVFGEAPGERHYLAEHFLDSPLVTATSNLIAPPPEVDSKRLHALALEFNLPEEKVLDLIAQRRMLRMAVRGSVAEEHLLTELRAIPGVTRCERLDDDRGPDVKLRFGGRDLTIECKNSSRVRTAEGYEKIDLQRTRAAKSDPCSRYYRPSDFDIVAACIHAVTGKWEFKYAPSKVLQPHNTCEGRLSNNVKLDGQWSRDATTALQLAIAS